VHARIAIERVLLYIDLLHAAVAAVATCRIRLSIDSSHISCVRECEAPITCVTLSLRGVDNGAVLSFVPCVPAFDAACSANNIWQHNALDACIDIALDS
jgi:hypothetical protein